MAAVLFVIVGLLAIGAIGGAFLFMRARNIFREQKNYERGLKMVPLLIHLPPPSDDIANNGRDFREITDENISKAQVLYNIIASTIQKGFKSKVYGQRHIAFEIVAQKGFVHYYAAVPVALVPVVQQAVVSAYPSARLEEVAEHNIFSPVGRISGTIGGELVLKENYAYSIATYQDLKRDAMQSLLNALSTLEKEDGAGLQILFRPADPSWRKKAGGLASKKRKGDKSKKGFELAGSLGKELFTAPFKPPEDKAGDKKPEDKQLSSLEQSIVDSIDDKTRYPGYEVLIRVVASSNISQRAQAVLNNIVATFALFDSPGKNGFKYVPARDIENFVTGYIMRFFPQENKSNILNVVELATIFHFPDARNIPTSQLERQASKQVDGPRNVMDEGMLLGYNLFRGTKKAIRLSNNDRRRHIYVVGQTGTGKSTFLENLALQDMLDGKGFAFVDPHGDTAEKLLSMVPKERTEDVIYFCPADMDYPLGLNLFEFHSPEQKDFLIQEAINMLYKLYDPQHQGIIGPRYEHWFRNAALTLMSDPQGATFIDIPKLFTDNKFAAEKKKHVTDQTVLDFWNKEMAQTADFHKSEVLGWFVSKFGAFLSNEMMRNIIGQTKSSFNLREVMDNKKILLVNLSKGRTGELNSKLLGMIFVMKFQAAAMSRASIPEEDRIDFALYVDEFQNFSTDSFADILSEARKYRLNLIVANQFTTQLTDQVRDAVFGNVGTIVAHRVGTADAEALVKVFQPVFDIEDLQRIPNYNAVMRMLINGVPTQPFSIADLPPLGNPNKQLGDALKQLSAAKYGRPKSIVEAEIFKRLATKEDPKPALGAGNSPFGRTAPGAGAGAGARPTPGAFQPASQLAPGAPARPAPGSPGSSFLDDWLNKKAAAPSSGAGGNSFARQPPVSMPPPPPAPAPPAPMDATAARPPQYPAQAVPSPQAGSPALAIPPAQQAAQVPEPFAAPVQPMASPAPAAFYNEPAPIQMNTQPAPPPTQYPTPAPIPVPVNPASQFAAAPPLPQSPPLPPQQEKPSNGYMQAPPSSAVSQSDSQEPPTVDPMALPPNDPSALQSGSGMPATPPSEVPPHKLQVQPTSDFLDTYLRKRNNLHLDQTSDSASALTPPQSYEQGSTGPANAQSGSTRVIRKEDVFPTVSNTSNSFASPIAPLASTASVAEPVPVAAPAYESSAPWRELNGGAPAEPELLVPETEAPPEQMEQPEQTEQSDYEPAPKSKRDIPNLELPSSDPPPEPQPELQSVEEPAPHVKETPISEVSAILEAATAAATPKTKSGSLEVNIRNHQQADSDTIFIDQDGNLFTDDENQDGKSPAATDDAKGKTPAASTEGSAETSTEGDKPAETPADDTKQASEPSSPSSPTSPTTGAASESDKTPAGQPDNKPPSDKPAPTGKTSNKR